jgi:hypothetical protein
VQVDSLLEGILLGHRLHQGQAVLINAPVSPKDSSGKIKKFPYPYQQMSSGFNPGEHTSKICWQVLQAAMTQLSS